ncbi:subtilase-type serine protease [Rubricella aquisinus]|uniref:Subtilase-type serine protease n=1 Tax=Rubricella aquisinus TaxID=2028108 RepID=A0A840WYN7_9RHOB|nr:S8 family peptidase [Rubricella aquisinus]MBB5516260.1 subtilase-type serine protease [Rubricella aquisinus]
MRGSFSHFILSVSLLGLAACGGGGGGSTAESGAAATGPVVASDMEARANYALRSVKALEANARGYTGRNVKIGIVDSGIQGTHQDFAGRIAGTYILRGGLTAADRDQVNHGTGVASVAAGARNGFGTQGVAYDATLYSYKLSDSSSIGYTDSDLAALINRQVADGVEISNNSWGGSPLVGSFGASTYMNGRPQIRDAYRNAVNNGVIFVFAAGNSGRSQVEMHGGAAHYDAILAPQWLTVVDVDSNLRETSYTNRCGLAQSFCVTAPGGNVVLASNSGGTRLNSGTSFAAPVVTGALALLKQAFPTLTSAQVVTRLKETATLNGLTTVSGCTINTCTEATMRNVFGRGLIDVNAATQPIAGLGMAQGAHLDGGLTPVEKARIALPAGVSAQVLAALGATQVAVFDQFDGAMFQVSADKLMEPIATTTRQIGYSADTAAAPAADVTFANGLSFATMTQADAHAFGQQAFWGGKLGLVAQPASARASGVEARYAASGWLSLGGYAAFSEDVEAASLGFDGVATLSERTRLRLGFSMAEGEAIGATQEGQSNFTFGLRHTLSDRVELFGQAALTRIDDTASGINTWGQTGAVMQDATLGLELLSDHHALSVGVYQPQAQVGGTAEITLASGRDLAGNIQYTTHRFDAADATAPGLFLALRGDVPGLSAGDFTLSVQQTPGNVQRTDQAAFKIGFQF